MMEIKGNFTAFLVQDLEPGSSIEMTHQDNHPPSSGEDHRQKSPRDVHSSHSAFPQDCHQIMEMETVLIEDLVKPVIFLLKHALPFPDTIQFDQGTKCCVLVKGGIFRKVFCILWQILALYRLVIKLIPSSDSASSDSDNSALTSIAMGAYLIFIIFTFVNFYVFWTRTKSICGIFNNVIRLAEKMYLKDRSPNRIKAVKCAVHASWIFVSIYVIITVILYVIDIFLPHWSNPNTSARLTLSFTNVSSGHAIRLPRLDFTNIHKSDDHIISQIITAIASFINIFNWMMVFFSLGVWGLFFRQLITIFYWKIETKHEMNQYLLIPQEIRTFNKIGSIIDDFNNIYGIQNLLGAIVCVTYISPSIKLAFSGLHNIFQMSAGWHLMLSYVPMIVTSLSLAEVQRMATNFAGILKNEFGRFTKECGDAAESLCGIAIVHYDLTNFNIGFQGLGFFTVSYQFITTVNRNRLHTIVSVIITYSILVLQLFPHENAIEV